MERKLILHRDDGIDSVVGPRHVESGHRDVDHHLGGCKCIFGSPCARYVPSRLIEGVGDKNPY